MTIQKRALILSALFAVALTFYSVAGYYSQNLIYHVVEQALIQKIPADVDSRTVKLRLEALVRAEPDKKVRIQRLLKISEYLEKKQRLTQEEWELFTIS